MKVNLSSFAGEPLGGPLKTLAVLLLLLFALPAWAGYTYQYLSEGALLTLVDYDANTDHEVDRDTAARKTRQQAKLIESLDAQGADGWELFSVTEGFWFKKPTE